MPLDESKPGPQPGKMEGPAKRIGPQDANQPTPAAPNQPAPAVSERPSKKPKIRLHFAVTTAQLSWLVRFTDCVLVLAAVLYCLTMLFSLKVSMLGRLGGINHISRAFFLSLAFVVLLLPWQKFFLFPHLVVGAIYTPEELFSGGTGQGKHIFGTVLHYLRFCGYWVLVMLLLIFAQLRSGRWTKAILRRLEVI